MAAEAEGRGIAGGETAATDVAEAALAAETIGTKRAAEIAAVAERTIRNWIEKGYLEVVPTLHGRQIVRASLDGYLRQREMELAGEVPPAQPPPPVVGPHALTALIEELAAQRQELAAHRAERAAQAEREARLQTQVQRLAFAYGRTKEQRDDLLRRVGEMEDEREERLALEAVAAERVALLAAPASPATAPATAVAAPAKRPWSLRDWLASLWDPGPS